MEPAINPAVAAVRAIFIRRGMESETLFGMKLTGKAPSAYKIAKQDAGLTGTKLQVYHDFCRLHGFTPNPKMPAPK
jgi:hypothetical protein